MSTREAYLNRRIEPHGFVEANGRFVKIYTISCNPEFSAHEILESSVRNLPQWLDRAAPLDFRADDFAILIVHEGRDGNWTLFYRWIESHMLHGLTFYSKDEIRFEPTPREGSMACVWELPIIAFERDLWIASMFGREFEAAREIYLGGQLSGEV